MCSVPSRSTSPGTPTPIAVGVGGQRPGQVEQHLDQPVAAVGGGDTVLGQDRARLRAGR